MKQICTLLLLLLLLVQCDLDELPPPNCTEREKFEVIYGGAAEEIGVDMKELADGYILLARTTSYGNGKQMLLINVDECGNQRWSSRLGQGDDEFPVSLEITNEGYTLFATSNSSEDSEWIGASDFQVMWTDKTGQELQHKNYGTSGKDVLHDAIKTSDDGYIMVGSTDDLGSGGADLLVIKINKDGNEDWRYSENIGNTGKIYDTPTAVKQASDGTYIIVGSTGINAVPFDGDQDFFYENDNSFIIRIPNDGDASGIIDTIFDISMNVEVINDFIIEGNQLILTGGAIIQSGQGANFDTGFISFRDFNGEQLELDRMYEALDEENFGKTVFGRVAFYSISSTMDGGYICTGITGESIQSNQENNRPECFKGTGNGDVFLLKVDANRNTIFKRTFGEGSINDSNFDAGKYIAPTRNGGYIILGQGEEKHLADKAAGAWLIKTDENGKID